MRIAIPGGSGLIGRHLASHMAGLGHACIILSRDPSRLRPGGRGIRIVPWDPGDHRQVSQTLAGYDAVVNLCGEGIAEGRWTDKRKAVLKASRINSGLTLTRAIAELPAAERPTVFIQASGIGYYEEDQESTPDEYALPGKSFLAKLALEWEASTQAVEDLGLRRVIIRTAIVLARSGGALREMIRPFWFFVGGPIGSGTQWLSWIHILDEVRAIQFLIEHPSACGPFNLCTPYAVRNAQFATVLGQILRRPSSMPVPAITMRILMGEMADIILKGSRVNPRRLQELGFTFTYPDLEQALLSLTN